MTKKTAKARDQDPSKTKESSSKARRNQVIKVKVNASEKAEIVRQKARMSLSAFLRERGLNPGHVYDPTYAAIGGIYQSVSLLRDSAAEFQEASITLQNFTAILTALGASADSQEPGEELREIATTLASHGERIEELANELGEQARALSKKHMSEMLKRYPAKAIKPRDPR